MLEVVRAASAAGSLTGASPESVTGAKPGSAPARVGAFAFVANPALIAGQEAYEAHMDAWLARYIKASGAEGRYPGQRAAIFFSTALRFVTFSRFTIASNAA